MDFRIAEGVIEHYKRKARQGFMHDHAVANAICGVGRRQAF